MLKKGSEWRRWDLHIHTPETALNNQFRDDWEEYLATIESQQDVKVLGVTDYLTITNYSKLKQFKDQGRIPNIDLLIPNIEFRLSPPSERGTAVNIHFLISPDDPKHENEIKNALGNLNLEFNENLYSCAPERLIALGKDFNNDIKDNNVALSEGVNQFKIGFSVLKDWFNREKWLNKNSIVGIAAGADGVSSFDFSGGWGVHRAEMSKFSQIIFSGNPNERNFWLDEEDAGTVQRLGGIKPCVHGSDAHSIEKMFNPDQDRYCWIKADTTFEGLRQILYEPEDRAYIGPTPPLYHDTARIIKSVQLSNSNGWFENITIPLNTGLVSIIGQKGSGKSALAELIAYTAGSWRSRNSSSFLDRANLHLTGMNIQLEWGEEDETDSISLFNDHNNSNRVRYLSQKFVEDLCANVGQGGELVKEIEKVIFSYIDSSEKLNASDFDELRSARTVGIKNERQQIQTNINRLIHEECELRDNARKLQEKKERIISLKNEHDGLKKQIPDAHSDEESKIEQQLFTKRTKISEVQRDIGNGKQTLQELSDIRDKINTFSLQMNHFHKELQSQLMKVGITKEKWILFEPEFSNDPDVPLRHREDEIKKQIADLQGSGPNPSVGSYLQLDAEIKDLEKKQTVDKARQDKVKQIQTRLTQINTEIEQINAEISRIEGPEEHRKKAVRQERYAAYMSYFINLGREHKTLEKLYAPVTESLNEDSALEHEKHLEFSIQWTADVDKWIDRGVDLFDQRKSIPYENKEGILQAAKEKLVPAWVSGEPENIRAGLEKFLEEFKSPTKYLRSDISYRELLQWIFEVDHITLSYDIKYKGTELDKLSPGTKGIVLLILYLGIDKGDTRPLIIDQPDENLDNESIFQILVGYFRNSKKRRQIILITHNPNLVVNTDSEQVIVAKVEKGEEGFPHITYTSGALEDAFIKEQVCNILEGGKDAFLKREKRYALDN